MAFLANNMDSYNAVIVSQEVLTEIFEVSKTTIWRALKLLRKITILKFTELEDLIFMPLMMIWFGTPGN